MRPSGILPQGIRYFGLPLLRLHGRGPILGQSGAEPTAILPFFSTRIGCSSNASHRTCTRFEIRPDWGRKGYSQPPEVEDYERFFAKKLTEAQNIIHITMAKHISTAYSISGIKWSIRIQS